MELLVDVLASDTGADRLTDYNTKNTYINFVIQWNPGGGGVTHLYGLHGDMPLDRVWFLTSLP